MVVERWSSYLHPDRLPDARLWVCRIAARHARQADEVFLADH